jgi:hypothetical protein
MWSRSKKPIGDASRRRVAVALGAFAAIGTAAVIAASCSSETTATAAKPVVDYGAAVAIGGGTARSYVVLDNGVPTELGVALSAAALDSLPSAPLMGGYEFVLPLPAQNTTQFQVIGLNWNPTGHPPPMVYTVPHFDVHFYMVSSADRAAIAPSDPSFAAEAANLPAVDLRPPGYVADPPANAIPRMGIHWTDTSSAEFHGAPFTRTFINGSWNGQFVFFEPMVTRAYLLTHPDDLVPVRAAARRATTGYYPANYRVSWDASASEWHIALSDLAR